ncbi:hypothetical protein [Azospirillum sp. sgz301742]
MTARHRIRHLAALALLGFGLLTAGPAQAAVRCVPVSADDVRRVVAAATPDIGGPSPGACGALALTGEIRPGDYAAVSALAERSGPFLARIDTVARGGDVAEAMRIGRLVRARHLSTVAPQYRPDRGGVFPAHCKPDTECICAGACFLVWVAGAERLGEHLLLRRLPEPEIAAYLAEMEVPPAYAATLATLPPGASRPLSEERLEADLKGPTASERRRITATCGEYSEAEAIDELALTSRKRLGTARLTPAEEQHLAVLQEKTAAVDRCRAATLIAERVRRWRNAPPP